MFSGPTKLKWDLIESAEKLVPIAEVFAISLAGDIEENFPSFEEAEVDWTEIIKIFTIAGVFIAQTRLNASKLSQNQINLVVEIVTKWLNGWSPGSLDLFEDCRIFFKTMYDALEKEKHDRRFLASDTIGMWIGSRIFKESSLEKAKELRAIGAMITHTFFYWWEEPVKE